MQFSALLMPALAALASAQSTTVISIFEAFDNDSPYSVTASWLTSLGASIAGVNADQTTLEVACMSNAPTSDCQLDSPLTIIAGPATLSYSKPLPVVLGYTTVTVTQDVQCSFTHKTESAVCTNSENLTYKGESTSTVTTKTVPASDITWMPVTVTAGLSKLNSPQATETADAAVGPHRPMITAAPLGAAAALAVAALF
ncbi:hypothetical protein N7448_006698 [Penicillium atrosanguineum]|uniref:Uncharacterized protein n=1 Tax=Penicillium atrosanguineum TaxID=1132637 RepID=A0A9W9GYU5_9EURO|nr:uncharacterized protein N7443_010459 [Penicillium atrosanguineum]KAJ5132540.1 hypothetical protein N7448_006698 [Penicillium atrosanguineum]KAJ5137245.1 hypothetical protein N7526_003478 [Penicillium atrosanguineum]KAJ5290206.1 hypothetical protein N7443_010459 [Penicillium atrosanguineum]KAJ5308030.1 hypothetical protein N7476_008686 [Penicillium atrosanguineum]